MVISLKPLPDEDDSKAELNNLDISEETEAKADQFWANFKRWRPMQKCGNHLKLCKWNFLQMDILDEPEDGTWGIVGHKVFEGRAWVKSTHTLQLFTQQNTALIKHSIKQQRQLITRQHRNIASYFPTKPTNNTRVTFG